MNHNIKSNEHVYIFVLLIVSIMACIMIYICKYLPLVLSNDDSDEKDIGLVNVSSINYISKTK